jgi:hypothetical protein
MCLKVCNISFQKSPSEPDLEQWSCWGCMSNMALGLQHSDGCNFAATTPD